MTTEHIPRLRVFAGPNGSGKTTLIEQLAKQIPLYHIVNPDYLLNQMISDGGVDLQAFGVQSTTAAFCRYVARSSYDQRIKNSLRNVVIQNGHMDVSGVSLDSYAVALIAAYLRTTMIRRRVSFSFETVFSHPSKLKELTNAVHAGYRVYLYFIATEQADINVSRVSQRASKGGHGVPPEKVRSRYDNSLNNLFPAMKIAYRAYVFDNSGSEAEWIAEVLPNSRLTLKTGAIPLWFRETVISRL